MTQLHKAIGSTVKKEDPAPETASPRKRAAQLSETLESNESFKSLKTMAESSAAAVKSLQSASAKQSADLSKGLIEFRAAQAANSKSLKDINSSMNDGFRDIGARFDHAIRSALSSQHSVPPPGPSPCRQPHGWSTPPSGLPGLPLQPFGIGGVSAVPTADPGDSIFGDDNSMASVDDGVLAGGFSPSKQPVYLSEERIMSLLQKMPNVNYATHSYMAEAFSFGVTRAVFNEWRQNEFQLSVAQYWHKIAQFKTVPQWKACIQRFLTDTPRAFALDSSDFTNLGSSDLPKWDILDFILDHCLDSDKLAETTQIPNNVD